MSAVGRMEAEEWKRQVSAQLEDPHGPVFVASIPRLVVIGGEHTEYDWCWCQPAMSMHGCGHRHGEHRAAMD